MADEEDLVTAVDGRMIDVSINPDTELVHLLIGSTIVVDLPPAAARELAARLVDAADGIHPAG